MSQEEIDKKFWEIVQGERGDQGQGKSTGGGTPGWLRWGFKVSEEGFFFSMLVGEGELAVSLAELIVETEMEARAADVYLAELEAQSEVVQQARTNIPLDANGDVTSWDDPAAPELATDGAGARSGGGCAATNNLPYQIHHFATDKNSTYTPAMAAIAGRYGLTLGGAWNTEPLPHNGRHPNEYHDFVLQNMQKADAEAAGNQARFLELFEQYVKDPVRRNPDLLRKCGWS